MKTTDAALILFLSICIGSCTTVTHPKPSGFLRLDFPSPAYQPIDNDRLPFTFDKNAIADVNAFKFADGAYTFNIEYKRIKGTVFITYKPLDVEVAKLIEDAQNLTQKHALKANAITEQLFVDRTRKVYGKLYEIDGDAASQAQFYLTDSLTHFLTGSLYFYARPNYDSLLPAADYIKNDIKKLMETLNWKKQ